ncbi:ACT domain-containing protein [Alienimonas sp. DA493]|uniref:[protein-PII] uridylyltransferase family protein n=1 Tax=Alienimonas sp. DA493 TaxID=3373605 RepID=UPI0037543ACB
MPASPSPADPPPAPDAEFARSVSGEPPPDAVPDAPPVDPLDEVPFDDPPAARRRLDATLAAAGDLAPGVKEKVLPPLLAALAGAPAPDASLVNFERFVRAAADRRDKPPHALFDYLAAHPRAVEILVRLFVGSQYLTDILIRNPDYLRRLTEHRRLPAFKSREDFLTEALSMADGQPSPAARLDGLRSYQHWELLRIGACDTFGLLDLRSVTAQLSLLADGFTQAGLNLIAGELGVDADRFCVLAFGKLGGEELNYSSDIDLAFLAEGDATQYWTLGQRLIKALSQATGEGFLYRVDMRLRPWGSSGPLVNTPESHLNYLRKHGRAWERQALVKARPIAGNLALGHDFLKAAEPLIYGSPAEEVRESVRASKKRIEDGLKTSGRTWGEVKSGAGSIRDIEFTVQCLQLVHGREQPGVRARGTLNGLARLADHGLLWADEYRRLTAGYHFLRTVEHALQLRHHRQVHALPEGERELRHLARRLDFPDAASFVAHYEEHCRAVRAVFKKYVIDGAEGGSASPAAGPAAPHADRMPPSYKTTFAAEQIARHAALLGGLTPDRPVALKAEPLPEEAAEPSLSEERRATGVALTVACFDQRGDFAAVCGLLFARGWDIGAADVFCESTLGTSEGRGVIMTFTLYRAEGADGPPPWEEFNAELGDLLRATRRGEARSARADLAALVATAVRPATSEGSATNLPAPPPPMTLDLDNNAAEDCTVLRVRAADQPGLLYGLTNALALFGIDLRRIAVRTRGGEAADVLHLTDRRGLKITDDRRLAELKAATALVGQFTHLLPYSPDPRRALTNFSELLESLFRRDDWVEEASRLGRSEVLTAVAGVLGVSDFLWHDFLRLQHENLFPIVASPETLDRRRTREELEEELNAELAAPPADGESPRQAARRALNRFKDRAMFRTDMRHILGKTKSGGVAGFSAFAEELTDIAEVTLSAATRLSLQSLIADYGEPRNAEGQPVPVAVCALGKCGGRELGFASDVELLVVYAEGGDTTGGARGGIGVAEFYNKLVKRLKDSVEAKREGIFELDFRLRPYGQAGSAAVRKDTFADYFGPGGAAWPYERQALIKLRPIAGDAAFGKEILALRDELIFGGRPADRAAVLAMREKQLRQLVTPGTVNAKLSPGGLVDVEYLVQILQWEHGGADPELRTPGTLAALTALHVGGHLPTPDHDALRDAYGFLRGLINALRVVRGNAKDLTVPPAGTEEFAFLARRLGYTRGPDGRPARERLAAEMDYHLERVRDVVQRHFPHPGANASPGS